MCTTSRSPAGGPAPLALEPGSRRFQPEPGALPARPPSRPRAGLSTRSKAACRITVVRPSNSRSRSRGRARRDRCPAPPESGPELLLPEEQRHRRLDDLDRRSAHAARIGGGGEPILGRARAGAAIGHDGRHELPLGRRVMPDHDDDSTGRMSFGRHLPGSTWRKHPKTTSGSIWPMICRGSSRCRRQRIQDRGRRRHREGRERAGIVRHLGPKALARPNIV